MRDAWPVLCTAAATQPTPPKSYRPGGPTSLPRGPRCRRRGGRRRRSCVPGTPHVSATRHVPAGRGDLRDSPPEPVRRFESCWGRPDTVSEIIPLTLGSRMFPLRISLTAGSPCSKASRSWFLRSIFSIFRRSRRTGSPRRPARPRLRRARLPDVPEDHREAGGEHGQRAPDRAGPLLRAGRPRGGAGAARPAATPRPQGARGAGAEALPTRGRGPAADLRSLGITDCPVTAMTVTRCDGRDITGVRYPPICSVLHCVITVGVGLITVFLVFMSIRSRTMLAGVGGSASQIWGIVLGASGGMWRA